MLRAIAPLLAVLYGGVPCEPAVAAATPEGSRCMQVASAVVDPARRVVVFATRGADEPEEEDVPHQVAVALLEHRGGADVIVDREEITEHLLDAGDRGEFARIAGIASTFRIADHTFVDTSVLAGLSGSGSISGATDIILLVEDGQLLVSAVLKDTAGWGRSGTRWRTETTSELTVSDHGISWLRETKTASASEPSSELTVTCESVRTGYRLTGTKLVPAELPRPDGDARTNRLPRLDLRPTLPCCNGCRVEP